MSNNIGNIYEEKKVVGYMDVKSKILMDSLYVGCYVRECITSEGGKTKHIIQVLPKRVLLYEDGPILRDLNTDEEVSFGVFTSSYFNENKNTDPTKIVSYVMPYREFLKKLMDIELETIDIENAKLMVGFYNRTASKNFFLSIDEEVASEQIAKLVYKKRLD